MIVRRLGNLSKLDLHIYWASRRSSKRNPHSHPTAGNKETYLILSIMARQHGTRGTVIGKGGPRAAPHSEGSVRSHAAFSCGGRREDCFCHGIRQLRAYSPQDWRYFCVIYTPHPSSTRVKPPRPSPLPTACVSRCPKRRPKVRLFYPHSHPTCEMQLL
jgi:hypothetical protein